MIQINVVKKRMLIHLIGTQIFDYLTSLPKDIRPDNKERTGIRILVRVPGTRNIVGVSIHHPSEAARIFAIEKSVRTDLYDDITSQDSEDEESMKFRGCVSMKINYEVFHSSVSGLVGSEDVAIAIIVMAISTDHTVSQVIINIKNRGGKLPAEIFQPNHYLYKLLNEYQEYTQKNVKTN